ncbi:MAG: methylated-DNA--[protein]-cysteine S-methyltransferase [Bacteriovoracaceae bacterium]
MQKRIKTDLGYLFISATNAGITRIAFTKDDKESSQTNERALAFIEKASVQIEEYLKGERKEFTVPVVYSGTKFQEKVWKELSKIPFGKTTNYSDIAAKIKNPKSVRAVGSANARNPICIIVPCHRVIGKNGELSGYIGGQEIKKKLLEIECH